MGGTPRGYKKDLQAQLIQMTLPAAMHEAALQKIAAKEVAAAENDDVDSLLSEILSDLDKEEGNASEIKDLKKKRRKYTRSSRDKPLEMPKAKAKGKAKAKAKAKAEAKQKPSFVQKMLKRMRNQGAATEAAAPMDGEVPQATPADVQMSEAAAEGSAQSLPLGGEPSSSSKAAPAAPSLNLDEPLPEPKESVPSSSSGLPAGPSSAKGEVVSEGPGGPVALRKSSTKVYRTPDDLLSSLAPPGASFTVNQPKHMFASLSRLDATALGAPYNQKSFSQNFGDRRPWEEALRRVHEFNWRKWEKLKEQAPLPPNAVAQEPGKIDPEVLAQVGKFVEQLPPKTKSK